MRLKLLVKGVVQGVGFRPFVYQLARLHKLNGWVLNSSEGVVIEVEGEKELLEAFQSDLKVKTPPRAVLASIEQKELKPAGFKEFVIKKSLPKDGKFQLVSPDIAICDDCLSELFDLTDRRYRYPFINCTNCGPRFTIIEDIPYDRPNTTMKKFRMCPECQAEYDNPMDRRFHAQPNACQKCGPELEFKGSRGQGAEGPSDSIRRAVEELRAGNVVAVKGLGGFHLACNAESDLAVKRLRDRKKRYGKPLAVMMPDLKQAEKHCFVSTKEGEILSSPQRPIVLLKKRPETILSKDLAPNNNYLGVMLPYTPLHYIILEDCAFPLVMTSGNLSEEPITAENEEAIKRLGHIADCFLLHNRDIYSRYDDPVVRLVDAEVNILRRARAYAPYPVHLPIKLDKQILAVGGELKNTFCLAKDSYAFVSQHIGDMENLETLEHFKKTLGLYKKLFRVTPTVVAHDLHPEYFATKYAEDLKDVQRIGVQHHHAHIVSCMVENGVRDKVIGVAFDGTGYGTDSTIWGGEFLISSWKSFERAAYLKQVRMPGGEIAIKKPYRMAFSYLYTIFGDKFRNLGIDYLNRLDLAEIEIMKKQIDGGLLSPLTSSAGRLFDAVSSLIGIRDEIEFEGQAAIELEMQANEAINERYDFEIVGSGVRGQGSKSEESLSLIVGTEPIIRGVVEDLQKGSAVPEISAKFHNTVVEFVADVCHRLRHATGVETIALSGGVYQNMYLLTRLKKLLETRGFKVLTHRLVPANDGGISLGQAIIASEQTKKGAEDHG